VLTSAFFDSSVLGWNGRTASKERSKIVINHGLGEFHVVALTRVEPKTAGLIQSLQADRVLFVHLQLFERDSVATIIPVPEPFRLAGHDDSVLLPHPHAEIFHSSQASLVPSVFDLKLVVDLGQEGGMIVEAIKVPVRTVVVRRCTPVLHNQELSEIAKNVVDEWTVPVAALLIHRDTSMRATKGVKKVYLQVCTRLNHSPCNQTSLRDSKQVDLFASEIRVVMKLMAHNVGLPPHSGEHGRYLTVADLDTLNWHLIVQRLRDHINPTCDIVATASNTVQQSDRSNVRVVSFHRFNHVFAIELINVKQVIKLLFKLKGLFSISDSS